MEKETILEVKDISVQFSKETPVLNGISFAIQKGEVLAVVGPNGAGKSVLFQALLGLISYSGTVRWKPGVKIGYVPQKLAIEHGFPLTVKEFLQLKGKSTKKSLVEAFHAVGLAENIQNKRLGDLSGGQFQRVLIAFALMGQPDVLLFDEPTAGVDLTGEETIYNLLHKLQDDKNLTIILISHDLNVVYKYANQVICINKEQICFGIPQDVLSPEGLSQLYGSEQKFFHHIHEHHK